ncbi:hypothetical protein [Noviherbaspirillum pedocola]|uniref:Uncharacterized protein n=1 Tax=Noviherbaspirillum pedocola TaxID=2801341 RepID=A0A934W8X1_9BURK|nr:hypothetical protein [Noviherbaspirillum pedocola]MBK4737323.1 hypothetical protein [Noviherbaspirillum pedocola]
MIVDDEANALAPRTPRLISMNGRTGISTSIAGGGICRSTGKDMCEGDLSVGVTFDALQIFPEQSAARAGLRKLGSGLVVQPHRQRIPLGLMLCTEYVFSQRISMRALRKLSLRYRYFTRRGRFLDIFLWRVDTA